MGVPCCVETPVDRGIAEEMMRVVMEEASVRTCGGVCPDRSAVWALQTAH